jgi:hypothetical protein
MILMAEITDYFSFGSTFTRTILVGLVIDSSPISMTPPPAEVLPSEDLFLSDVVDGVSSLLELLQESSNSAKS